MDKFERVVDGLKHIQDYLECTKSCPYYEESCAYDDCKIVDDAIKLISLRKQIDEKNITTQQAVNHLKEVGWLKMYEEFIMMKKRLGLTTTEEEYTYENWH